MINKIITKELKVIFFYIKTFKLQEMFYFMPEKERKNAVYVVSIKGSNTNFEVPISSVADFEDLDGILDILKKKMQNK